MTDQISTEEAVGILVDLRKYYAVNKSSSSENFRAAMDAALTLAITRLSTPSVGEFLEATKGLTFFTAESGYALVIGDGAPLRAAILSVGGGVK